MAKNKNGGTDIDETEIDDIEKDGTETGDDSSDESLGAKANKKAAKNEPLVTVVNRGKQTFQHAVHGDLAPGQMAEFPESHAKNLIRLSDGQIVDQETANNDFKQSNADNKSRFGYDSDSDTLVGHQGDKPFIDQKTADISDGVKSKRGK
jgi:hypothetical protein